MLARQLASVAVIREALAIGMITGAWPDDTVPVAAPTACWQSRLTVATDNGTIVSSMIVASRTSTFIAVARALHQRPHPSVATACDGIMASTVIASTLADCALAVTAQTICR